MSNWRSRPRRKRKAKDVAAAAEAKAQQLRQRPAQRVEDFIETTRTKLEADAAELPKLKALHARLQKEAAGMKQRWELRAKARILRDVASIERRMADVESGGQLLQFNRDAAAATSALARAKAFADGSVSVVANVGVGSSGNTPAPRKRTCLDNGSGNGTGSGKGRRRRTPQVHCHEVTAAHMRLVDPDSDVMASQSSQPSQPSQSPAGTGAGGTASASARGVFDEHAAPVAPTAPQTQVDGSKDGGKVLFDEAVEVEFLGQYNGDLTGNLYSVPEERCGYCGHVMEQDQANHVQVCVSCHREKNMVDSTTSFGQALSKTDRYRRRGYFRDRLAMLQGLYTNRKLTNRVVNQVGRYLAEQGVPKKGINSSTVELALEALGHNKLVPCRNAIVARLTGETPPRFTPEQFAQLDQMCAQVIAAFGKLKEQGSDRLNMPSYNLMAYKLIQMMSWGKPWLKHFRAPEKKEKLSKQDKLWKAFCQLIPSFTYIKTA